MAILEQDKRCRKAFVDQHRGGNEKSFEIGKVVPNTHGKNARQTLIVVDGAILDCRRRKWRFRIGTLTGEILLQKVNGFQLKPYSGPTPPNPFENLVEQMIKDVGPLPTESSWSGGPTSH